MDSGNLAVILAPNLFHFGDGTEKMNGNMEKRIKLQTTVVHCFIENASRFGTNFHLFHTSLSKCSFAANFLRRVSQGCCRTFFKTKFQPCWAARLGFSPPTWVSRRSRTSALGWRREAGVALEVRGTRQSAVLSLQPEGVHGYLERKWRSWSSGLKPSGLSRISDVVSGALNKMKTNRTPTNAPQSDGLGRYRGWTAAACDESTAIHLLWIHTSSFHLPISLHPTPSW